MSATDLRVDSKVGCGTIFHFDVPIVEDNQLFDCGFPLNDDEYEESEDDIVIIPEYDEGGP